MSKLHTISSLQGLSNKKKEKGIGARKHFTENKTANIRKKNTNAMDKKDHFFSWESHCSRHVIDRLPSLHKQKSNSFYDAFFSCNYIE